MAAAAQGPPAAPELEGARVLHREAPAEEARRLRAEADALAARLEAARLEERDLLGELSFVDRELAVAERRARATALEAGQALRLEEEAAERALALERRLAAARRRVGLVLQALYREGPRREWRRLVEGGAGRGDEAAASAVASAAALRQAELGRELELAAEAAGRAREQAASRRVEADRARAAREAALVELEARRRARERGLAGLRRESGRLGAELARAESALQDRLAGAPTPPAATARPAPARLSDLDARRGALPWPLDEGDRGLVLERFGEVVNPRYGTRTLRHGLVLEAPAGAPIRAVAPGRVVFRDWYKGFGLSLVVDHGHGFLSVAAHARELFVHPGEPVEEGQVVGAVGDTGSLEGPRLYFQLQREGEPVDPLEWLER